MKILVRQATIADPASASNGQVQDILIIDNTITRIAPRIEETADHTIAAKGLMVSPGWVDVFADFADPGYEFRETIASGAAAAAAGGFTRVFVIPNTSPVVENKTQVEYIVNQSASLPVTVHPLGAVTKAAEGKELAEMFDMRNSGAIAFSDGISPVQSPGLLLKALQYTKAFEGVLIQVPVDKSIGAGGLINEGIVSTRLGLPGIPGIGEEISLRRDIDLLRYTQSRLHITGVSLAASAELVRAAKKEGLQVTCSVTPYHLFFCDEDLAEYDTNLKVSPPLRSRADMLALRKAVVDGTVDCIASHHFPYDWDHKHCEFEYAKNGMGGLETVFAAVNHVLPELSAEAMVKLFSLNARAIFGLPDAVIAEGAPAELSFFSRKGTTLLQQQQSRSKSSNSAFFGKELNGTVAGIVHKGHLIVNQTI
ncbi:dihydroorotase [Sediminibacterium soli]|uniref:dihydroorotase n=1 Tax=Sediminibacterium soli TaxID=2698829 RepID=UPI00137B0ACE|nr:dihydroorotase [Sediminibacterium soli]NCI46217.1 dihydroorotase [Sediminibacterium soli]